MVWESLEDKSVSMKTILVMLVLLLVSMFCQLADVTSALETSTLIRVPDDYKTIQEAINAANPGDTILVAAGTYYEHVVVNKTVTLVGESRESTVIDGAGQPEVLETTANNVQISGFTIKNLLEGKYPYGTGIYLHYSNDSAIRDNVITENGNGIASQNSYNITISENIITSNPSEGILFQTKSDDCTISSNVLRWNHWGLRLWNSRNTTIRDNIIDNNNYGIELGSCINTVLVNNDVKNNRGALEGIGSGIRLHNSRGSILEGNVMINNTYNFRVDGAQLEHFTHNIDSSNTVGGKPIYYLVNETGVQVPADAGYVAAVNCVNVSIIDLDLKHNFQGVLLANTTGSSVQRIKAEENSVGIYLFYSKNNTLEDNAIKHNPEWIKLEPGIHLEYSDNNKLINNKMSDNLIGIRLHHSNHNTLGNNSVTRSRERGIILRYSSNNILRGNNMSLNEWEGLLLYYSDNNTVYHNNFIDNTNGVYVSQESTNLWDDGYPSGGNYWSDYTEVDLYSGPYQNDTGSDGIGDTPYVINARNQDNYPLMSPFEYWGNPISGDINKDMKVDYKDLFQLATSYNSNPEEPNWNPNADLNSDAEINYKDLFILAANYGETYP